VLRDGTTLRDLIDLDRREWRCGCLRIRSSTAGAAAHFAPAWVGLAHVSESPTSGDFVVRHIGEDRVHRHPYFGGEISVLLNVCAIGL